VKTFTSLYSSHLFLYNSSQAKNYFSKMTNQKMADFFPSQPEDHMDNYTITFKKNKFL